MTRGNSPIDDGNFLLSEDEKNILISKYPQSEKFIKNFVNARNFLHNEKNFCLWFLYFVI